MCYFDVEVREPCGYDPVLDINVCSFGHFYLFKGRIFCKSRVVRDVIIPITCSSVLHDVHYFHELLIDVLNVLEVAGLCCFSDHGMKVGVCLLFVLSSGSLLRSPMFYGNLLLRE